MVYHISSSLREGRNGNEKGGMGMRQVGTRMGSCCKHIVKHGHRWEGGRNYSTKMLIRLFTAVNNVVGESLETAATMGANCRLWGGTGCNK